jgi:hypothetical protein
MIHRKMMCLLPDIIAWYNIFWIEMKAYLARSSFNLSLYAIDLLWKGQSFFFTC